MPHNGSQANGKVTIFDVAEASGVSYGTVSRVINNGPHVKPTTRAKVMDAIERLGYVINRQAQNLARGQTDAIGVLVPDLGTGYIGEIMRGIDAELERVGYDLMLFTTHRRAAKEANYVTTLVQGVVEGLLIVLPRNPADYLGALRSHSFPHVLIDHQGVDSDGPAVGATNWQGAFLATEYLINLGHQRIGFITGSMDLGCSQDRLEGYKSALRTHHVPEQPELIYEGDFFQSTGVTGANALLDLPEPPTAIFASNDVMAMGAMDAIRHRGLRIPDDISIMGFDNIPQSAMVYPPLTTVQQPLEQMGRVATQILLEMLEQSQVSGRRIDLPTELILRASCAPLKS
ncbi:LacI family transcriptional regulator [bacterium]|nr:MAG: LacI family transcriptional regulator [bacterium]